MEYEKLRQDGLWSRVLEGAQQPKNGTLDPVSHFYVGEAKLESLVEMLNDQKISVVPDNAKKVLVELKTSFGQLLKAPLPPEYVRLTRLLIAKTCFLLGDTSECMMCLDKSDLGRVDMSQDLGRRNLKIFAESFCLRGMCSVRSMAANLKVNKKSDRLEQQVMNNFEIANDASLRCCQLAEPSSGSSDIPFILGDLLENALIRTPNLYAKYGLLAPSLVRFRDTLRATETYALRRIRLPLARQLLEILLRGYFGGHYIDPRMTERQESAGSASGVTVSRPKKYPLNGSFVPLALLEEVLLLCCICEAIIVRDLAARVPDDSRLRKQLIAQSTIVADLCVISFSRLQHIQLGIPFMERAAKSCTLSYHIWRQFALNLMIRADHSKALHVLEQCFRFSSSDRVLFIFAAKLCVEQLLNVESGIRYAEALCRISDRTRFSGRARLILGVAYSMKASLIRELSRQGEYRAKAVSYFLQAESEDPSDFLVQYHLALEYCIKRELQTGFKHIKRCLRMNMDFLPAHHLLALILSSWKRYEEALIVLEKVELEFEDDLEVELTKIKLRCRISGPEDALKSCKQLLWLWKRTFERDLDRERIRTTSPENFNYPTSPNGLLPHASPVLPVYGRDATLAVVPSKVSPSSPLISSATERSDAVSYRAESVGALPRNEGTISEMASTTGSYLAKSAPQSASTSQLSIWILMAELYMSLDQHDNALECLTEAANAGPPSHLVYHLQGAILLHQNRGTPDEARRFFENALAISPWYPPAHMEIGRILRDEDFFPEAERHFKEALQGDPCCFEAWSALGELYVEKQNDELAMEYLDMARKMESSQPIQSFYHLPRCISY